MLSSSSREGGADIISWVWTCTFTALEAISEPAKALLMSELKPEPTQAELGFVLFGTKVKESKQLKRTTDQQQCQHFVTGLMLQL